MKSLILLLLACYQSFSFVLRSFMGYTGPCCRFYPTCSNYAKEAISVHGAVKGSFLTVKRICKCHPLGGHGYDPVPILVAPNSARIGGYRG